MEQHRSRFSFDRESSRRHSAGSTPLPSWRAALTAWLFGLVVFATVVGVLLHLSELEELARLLRRLRPIWLLAAFVLQGLTYVSAAAVWQIALAHEGRYLRVRSLVPTALAMLFINQAFPSGGLSGSAVVVRALGRRHLPPNLVMGALLVGLVTTYAAYLVAVTIGLVLLRVYHAVSVALLLVTGVFALITVGVPTALVWYRRSLAPRLQSRVKRLPGLGPLLVAIGSTPAEVLSDRSLLARAMALQLGEIVLDAATLQVMLAATGMTVAPTAVFGSFAVASAVSRVVPVPLGLGTFEGALVAMLHVVGVPLETALTATLLLRGFTLWLPMLPGLWCARREVWH